MAPCILGTEFLPWVSGVERYWEQGVEGLETVIPVKLHNSISRWMLCDL